MLVTEIGSLPEEGRARLERVVAVEGGVELVADVRGLFRLLVEVGLASHVLVRVATFFARDLDALEAHVARLPWSGWLRRGEPRRIRVRSRKSRLHHTGAIEARVSRAIAARLDDGTRDDDDGVPIAVRFEADRCTISLDAAGEPLHRRGYRLDPHRAPLREDIARALLMASGWDGREPLVDPLAGSGTIVIEAARWARNHAPGLERSFAVERTALGDERLLADVRAEARARLCDVATPILGRDRDPRAVEAALSNARRAHVDTQVAFEVGRLGEARKSIDVRESAQRWAVVTNPPWGERIGDAETLRPLYGSLGALVRAIGSGRFALACHDRRLAYATGVRLRSALLTEVGGTKVSLMVSEGAQR